MTSIREFAISLFFTNIDVETESPFVRRSVYLDAGDW